jgi:uncharacterized protein (UPF0332 family)
MKFDWSEYLNLAQELAASNEEAKLRSAISRAYYSVFCLARNYLRDIQQDPRLSRNKTYDINDHQYVADEFIFNRSKSQKISEIGRNLTRLRRLRNQADCEDTIFKLQKEVGRALSLGRDIILALRELTEEARS